MVKYVDCEWASKKLYWSNSGGAWINLEDILKTTGYFGVSRVWNFVREVLPNATKIKIQMILKNCEPCHSIDPAPVQWKKGSLNGKENWERLVMDITHYGL